MGERQRGREKGAKSKVKKTYLTAFLPKSIYLTTPCIRGSLGSYLHTFEHPRGLREMLFSLEHDSLQPREKTSKTNDGLAREVWLALSAYRSKEELEMSPGQRALRFSLSLGVDPVQSFRQCAKLQKKDFQSPLLESQMS